LDVSSLGLKEFGRSIQLVFFGLEIECQRAPNINVGRLALGWKPASVRRKFSSMFF